MKPRLFALLLSVSLSLTLASLASAAPSPTKADISKLVADAATYEPGQNCEAFRRIEVLLRDPSSSVHKRVEDGLVQLLTTGSTFEARQFACKQLGIIGSKAALPAIAKLLQSDDTAGIACVALTTYPTGKADEILRTALPSARGTARIQIINTLGDRRDARAVKLLAQSAVDADLSVAQAAISALGKIAVQAAWNAIVALPQDADPALQPALTEATLRCAEARVDARDTKAATALYQALLAPSHPGYVRRASFEALIKLDKAQAQARILEVLHGSDSILKPAAIANVRGLPSTDASEIFAAEFPNLSPQEQVWMIDSLAARGDSAASTAIGNSLASPQATVRRAAIDALGRMGNAWCVALFTHVLDRSNDAGERRALESALISLPGSAQTDRAIVAALKKSSGITRADLVAAISRREGPAANPLLLSEARQDDPVVAKSALRALAKTAVDRDVIPLLERLISAQDAVIRAEAENAAAQAIPRIDSPGRRSALVRQALGWAQPIESRVALLGLLCACGDATALSALKTAAANSDFRVREAAVRALADWPDASAWVTLADIYLQPKSEVVRSLALRGLVRLVREENAHPSANLLQHYRLLLKGAQNDTDLRLILGALGGVAQPGALELTLPYLADDSMRAEAEVAVKKIAAAIKTQYPQAAQQALDRLQTKP